MGQIIIKYESMKFRKRREKWGEIYWEVKDHKCNMVRGIIRLYGNTPKQRWLFSKGYGMLLSSLGLRDISNFIDKLNNS